jgi:putative protease
VKENIIKQLQKLGGTAFVAGQIDINIPDPLFIPLSTLNLLRRNGIEKMIEERLKNHPRAQRALIPNQVPFPSQFLDFTANVLNQKARTFYLRHGVIDISSAAESGIVMQGKKVMTTRYCIKYQLDMCPRQKRHFPPQGELSLEDEDGRQFPLKFDCRLCQMEVYFNTYIK